MAGIEALEKQIAELESRLKQLDATAEGYTDSPRNCPPPSSNSTACT